MLCRCTIYFKYDRDDKSKPWSLSEGTNVGNNGKRLPGHDAIGTKIVKCPAHVALTDEDAYAVADEEDKRLIRTLSMILDTLGYDHEKFPREITPNYSYAMSGTVPRTLHVHSAGTMTAEERTAVEAACAVRFGDGKVFVDG